MNDRDRAMKENENARAFEMSSSRHRNCCRLNAGSSEAHETLKATVCYHILKKGHCFLTEAIVEKSRKRCDVVDISAGICYEILYSEEAESIKQKRAEYPFFIIVVEVGKPLPKELIG